jgi:gliding motility-associated-like protein
MNLPLHHSPFKLILFFLFTGSVCFSQTVSPVPSQTVCNGSSVSAINFSGSGTTYNWTNNTGSIGLATSGTGNIASFTGFNSGTTPVTANLTVVPSMTAMVLYTQTFNYTGSISSFTVPAGVTSLNITASGAKGGDVSGSDGSASGGKGLKVIANVNVTPGDVLNILVGQQPPSATNASGGGGGTFIWNTSAANALLVAAGGGGGAAVTAFGCNCPQAGGDPGWATYGNGGTGGLGGRGTGGNGGGAVPGAENGMYGGGGAGWLTNGVAASANGACPQAGTASKTPLNGGTGGTSAGGPWGASINGYGGFGGGGGAAGFCGGQGGGGGGGGYSGGAGGNYTSSPNKSFGGGAGGSYSSGSVTGVAYGFGQGQLIIQYTAPGIVTGTPANFNITVLPTPTVNATPTATTLCSGQSHTITLGSSIPGSTYGWNVVLVSGSVGAPGPFSGTSSVITNTFSGSAVFTYSIVASYNGCQSAVVNSSVTLNALPTVGSSASNSVICLGNSTTLTGNGTANSYTWSGGVTDGVAFSPTVTATYTVTGTNSNGCSRTATRVITVNPLPVLTVNNGSICAGQVFTMTPSGATTYTYSSPGNTVSPGVGITTYSVTGTNANGCVSASAAISSLTVQALPLIAVNSGSICAAQTFTMNPSGAVSYTYSSGTNAVSPPVGTNTFSVTGTNANGCVSAAPAVSSVTVHALPTLSVNSGSICAGQVFTMTPSGATTYTYSSPGNTVSPGVGITTYSVTGTNANGCVSASAAISSLTVQALPVITVNSGSICAAQTFTMNPSGAVSYTYSSGTNAVSPPVGTNTFSVTGTNANGCVSAAPAVSSVTVHALPTLSVNSGSICPGNTFTITPSGAISYTISGGSATVSPITTTTYSMTGTNAQGCITAGPVMSTVTVHASPTISLTPSSATICTGNNTVLTPTGANTYTLQPGALTGSSFTLNPSSTITYSLSGTSLQNCPSANTQTAHVTVNTTPTISIAPITATICSGNSTVLTPGGANTYTLQPGAFTGSSFTVSPSSTTTYSLSGMSLQNCPSINTPTAQVTVNITPTISMAPTTATICSGNSTVLTPGGTDTYTLQPGALTGSSFTLSPSSTTTYSLSGMSLQNCPSINTPTTQVTVNITPTISIAPITTTICSGNSTVLTPGGANTYTLQPGALTGSSFTLSPSSTTTYSLNGMSLQNCPSVNTPTAHVTVNITPTISIAPTTATICSGNSTVLSPGGANTYTLQPGSLTGSSFTLSPSSTITYSLSGMSLQNCPSVNTPTAQVTVNITPTISIAPITTTICSGNSTVLTPGGANTYTLQPGALTGSSFTLSPSSTITYSLSGMSLQNCPSVNTPTTQVTVNITPTISIAPTTATICSGNSTVLSPGGANTYTLQPGALTGSSFTLSPSSTITYSLSGMSLQNCPSINTPTAQVTVNITPTISIAPITTTICSGNSTVLTPGGANTYTLQPGALTGSSFTLSPSSTTTYSLNGMSLQNCPSVNTPTTQVTVNITPTISINSGAICIGQSFTMVPSGANTYTYSGGSAVVSPASTSSYTVTGTASNGCISATGAVSQVTVNPLPVITIAATSTSVCQGQSATLSASGANTYTWNTSSNARNITVSPLTTTSYTVHGSNGPGCIASSAFTLVTYVTPTVNIGGDVEIHFGEAYPFNPTQTGAVSYLWSPTTELSNPLSINPTVIAESDITYTLTVTSADGCIASDAVNVKVLNDLIIANYMSPNGDGANDTWKVNAPGLIRDYSVVIIDSYGKTVFSVGRNYNNEFDGKLGGQDLPDGVYYYFIKDGNDTKFKGSITLTH